MNSLKAFLVAPMVGALFLMAFMILRATFLISRRLPDWDLELLGGFVFIILVSYAHATVVGIPLWFAASKMGWMSRGVAMGAGAIVAIFPLIGFLLGMPGGWLFLLVITAGPISLPLSGAIAGAVWWHVYSRGQTQIIQVERPGE